METMQVAVAKRALDWSPYCGDECGFWQSGGKVTICVVDGLGHGKLAMRAAKAAVDYVSHHLSEQLPEIFAGCNKALRDTRGVVMGLAIIDRDAGSMIYAGIGNTRVMVVRGQQSKRKATFLISDYGIVGGGYGTLKPQTVNLGQGDLVILFTDGVTERVDINDYDDVMFTDVKRLAKRILQDWSRETDDAAVLVYKNEGA